MVTMKSSAIRIFVFLIFFCSSAFPQSSPTSLPGTAADPRGAAVVGATVTLVHAESKTECRTVTGAQGEYRRTEAIDANALSQLL